MSERSGKSKSEANPFGIRRKKDGKEVAPRSARKKGKKLMSDCSEKDLKWAKII